jgi:hypothetical protein
MVSSVVSSAVASKEVPFEEGSRVSAAGAVNVAKARALHSTLWLRQSLFWHSLQQYTATLQRPQALSFAPLHSSNGPQLLQV